MSQRIKLLRVTPTDQHVYENRRAFLKQLGFGGLALTGLGGCDVHAQPPAEVPGMLRPGIERAQVLKLFPAKRNAAYNLDVELTPRTVAATHNNFYEFLPGQAGNLWAAAQWFKTDPWVIEVTGQCHKPRKFDVDAMFKFELEERTYRFRCVEAWAMDVPWTGFELNKLLTAVEPKSDAKFVRFTSAVDRNQMPGVATQGQYPWPYFEALTMAEAMHPLTLMATGIYGQPLPRQHGAPFRIVVPWKYGYKNPKSIVRIELLEKQPKTFWQTLSPREYSFESNVDPAVPHPRWSQASERVLGTNRSRQTLPLNGYGQHVAQLYKS